MEEIEVLSFGDADRSGKVRWLAEELGLQVTEAPVPFGGHRTPAYRELNPLGVIPTVRFRGQVLTESTSILHTLAEAFDEPKLWVGRGEPERRAYLHALAVYGESMEGPLVEAVVSQFGLLGPEYFALHEKKLRRSLGILARQLPEHGYLAGGFTLADIVAGYSLRLAIQAGLVERAAVEPYFSRLVERPAAQRARVFASLESAVQNG
jgi:glutathione S-transferase